VKFFFLSSNVSVFFCEKCTRCLKKIRFFFFFFFFFFYMCVIRKKGKEFLMIKSLIFVWIVCRLEGPERSRWHSRTSEALCSSIDLFFSTLCCRELIKQITRLKRGGIWMELSGSISLVYENTSLRVRIWVIRVELCLQNHIQSVKKKIKKIKNKIK